MPPIYSETFLCTALPAGRNGDQLTVDVLVSPRLMSSDGAPAGLDNWPNAKAWPEISPTWVVTIEQDGQTYEFTATEAAAGSYDVAAWNGYPARPIDQAPYVPKDRSETPIFSYPAAMVRDAARDLHVHALVNSRTEFPMVEDLRDDSPVFQCLLEAAHPAAADRARVRQLAGPVADADVECHEAFAMAEGCFHGVRPGSERGPVITSLDPAQVKIRTTPTVRILGDGLAEATDVTILGGDAPLELTFTTVSDDELRFTAPRLNAPATRTVRVLTPLGSATATLAYVLPDPPVITEIKPQRLDYQANATTCEIIGTNLGDATNVRTATVEANPVVFDYEPVRPGDPTQGRTFIQNSDTSITIVVGKFSLGTRLDVTVTTASGTSNAYQLTVVDPNAPK